MSSWGWVVVVQGIIDDAEVPPALYSHQNAQQLLLQPQLLEQHALYLY